MYQFLISAVAFIVLIGVMIVVHEFGHFLVAKLCGVRVERFSVGFPPRLFGIKIGETDYCISATPLGGYVKMTGENLPGENMSLEGADKDKVEAEKADPGALTSHPRWQQMLIAVAGPTANFLLALVLMLVYFGWINEVPSVQVKTTTVEWVTPDSAAAKAGFEPGDVIRSFDSENRPNWDQIYEHVKLNANQPVPVTVERGTQTLALTLRVPADAKDDDFDLGDAGLLPLYLTGPIHVADVEADTPAARAGLRTGDAIESVDGHAFHYVPTLAAYLQSGKGKTVSLMVDRNGVALPPMIVYPAKLEGNTWMLGFSGAAIPFRDDPLPLGAALSKSAAFCKSNSLLIVEVLQRIFEHRVSVSQLSGPVGIAVMAGQAAQMKSWYPKFGLAGEISLNLGILNLLPFPILDGGMILFLLIESVLRHDIDLNVKERIYQAAFVVIVVFFVFIIFNDVTKLPMFSHIKP
jgi:regulator of sigma E protease